MSWTASSGSPASYVIEEVRRQFREHPGILTRTEKPSYGQCVDIVTAGALKQMVLPGLLIIGMPIVVGLVFKQLGIGAEAVAAFLMVGTIAGILMATVLNNSGGAWDNSKKYIETDKMGGKGSIGQWVSAGMAAEVPFRLGANFVCGWDSAKRALIEAVMTSSSGPGSPIRAESRSRSRRPAALTAR